MHAHAPEYGSQTATLPPGRSWPRVEEFEVFISTGSTLWKKSACYIERPSGSVAFAFETHFVFACGQTWSNTPGFSLSVFHAWVIALFDLKRTVRKQRSYICDHTSNKRSYILQGFSAVHSIYMHVPSRCFHFTSTATSMVCAFASFFFAWSVSSSTSARIDTPVHYECGPSVFPEALGFPWQPPFLKDEEDLVDSFCLFGSVEELAEPGALLQRSWGKVL